MAGNPARSDAGRVAAACFQPRLRMPRDPGRGGRSRRRREQGYRGGPVGYLRAHAFALVPIRPSPFGPLDFASDHARGSGPMAALPASGGYRWRRVSRRGHRDRSPWIEGDADLPRRRSRPRGCLVRNGLAHRRRRVAGGFGAAAGGDFHRPRAACAPVLLEKYGSGCGAGPAGPKGGGGLEAESSHSRGYRDTAQWARAASSI